VKTLCVKRLDEAANDAELATEVLAAFSAGMSALITEYVDSKVAADEPATISRALMICGFSDVNVHADGILDRFRQHTGFIGGAYKAARFAYERNAWARHWYEKMKSARGPDEFWRFSVLFEKVVDGRYALWRGDYGSPAEAFQQFFGTVCAERSTRIKKWYDKRQKKLFGQDVPDSIFLLKP
jgi:hypothetical protein